MDLTSPVTSDFVRKWDSEICLFKAASSSSLLKQINEVLAYLDAAGNEGNGVLLKDVAYTAALAFMAGRDIAQDYCLSVVASSISDLKTKLKSAASHITEKSHVTIDGTASGIYYSNHASHKKGKLAFLLPGLGAAYPNMLSDLCLHFPEVREVFDFADYLAVSIAENEFPSDAIFPKQLVKGRRQQVSSTTLATMDSAVLTLLLAEWAIFHLLQNLGVEADAVMGCSTGEFAAMPMSGTTDILAAAGLFYKQSIAVARSFPEEKVKRLRSLMLAAPLEKVTAVLSELSEVMYVTADMSPNQVIVTGLVEASDEAVAAFQRAGIHVDKLPVAIPYHTPLVDDTLNLEPEGFQDLPMTAPYPDAWACSTAGKLPDDEQELRKMSTTLFRHPIQFRRTVELMYEDGVRIFVEVGPRDNLTPHVKEILAGKPHVAVPSNVLTRSAISQINHLLAYLAISGVNIKADYLFARRSPKTINFALSTNSQVTSRQVRLDLKYPEIPTNLPPAVKELLSCRSEIVERDNLEDSQESPVDGMDAVMESYLNGIASFQSNLMKVEEAVMVEFLQQSQQIADEENVQEDTFERPFLRNARISRQEDSIIVERSLTLDADRYLLDHAIGGTVSASDGKKDKVYLLPLMVAIEMMAEAAQELMPAKILVQIKQVRANKRIRVDSNGTCLIITARMKTEIKNASVLEAEIRSSDREAECLMSCQLVFDYEHAPSPKARIALADGRYPKLDKSKLYGTDAMFHGPTMQSVLELTKCLRAKNFRVG